MIRVVKVGAEYFRKRILCAADFFVHSCLLILNHLLEISAPLDRSVTTTSRTGYLAPASSLRRYLDLGANPLL